MDPDPIILFQHIPLRFYLQLIIFLMLLLCSALISGSEVALFSMSKNDLEVPEDDKNFTRFSLVKDLLQTPKKLLATILVVNNFINIAIVLLFDALGNYFLHSIDVVWWDWFSLRFFVEVILVTFIILLFGEILPKIYASRNNLQFAANMAAPLNVLNKALFFVNKPMRYITLKIHDQFEDQKTEINVSHLSHALEVASADETSPEEKRILEGIVNFGNTEVTQVMCPRTNIFALSNSEEFASAVSLIKSNGYSRVPVYDDSVDKIKGVLYVKDLLQHLDQTTFEWQKLVQKTMFIPENKKLDDLLIEFKEKKNHMAIVVDEYGGTSGLVTMDDIVGEIVGDISDEFDDEDLVYKRLDKNTYIFEGRTHLKDFYKVTKMANIKAFEKHKGEAETLAGFLLEVSNNFPRRGEKIVFENYRFVVESLDKKRIKQIKFTETNAG